MKIRIKLLGTGGSFGIPVIGCKCAVCQSKEKKNQRLRASCLVEYLDKRLYIDATPDIRQVCLQNKIDHIDGLFITHYHEDHTGGLNDLRPLFFKEGNKPIPLYLSEESFKEISQRFGYLLDRFEVHVLKTASGQYRDFHYFSYSQESTSVTGFRFDDFAYVTDIKEYPESIFEALDRVQILVLGAIHARGTPMHFSFDEAIEFGQNVKAKRVILTHLSHEVEHEALSQSLPQGFELGYDGMVINV